MKAVVNAKRVKEAIIELFRSTKAEVSEYLADNRENYPNFTIVTDFWTCKVTHNKFLGIRVYLIDKEWKFNSILLGTKQFDPVYSDRVGGIGKPFRMWQTKMLESFGLTISDFYGTTSDSGGDVKLEEQPIASRANLNRLEARFVPHAARPVIPSRVDRRGEVELDRWLDDPIGVLRNDDMTPNESVLEFWQRLEQSGEYRLIPKAVCRSSLAGENIDMCIFLNRNSEFVNLLQCEEIPRGQHQQYVPPSIGFDLDPYIFMDDIDSSILAEFVSSTNLSDLEDEEQKSSQ
ncbi:unnamed protein product [Phytophthora fragariaefolia]|uniref:Unnamed protein product n=1 Tax=Phytophthora fragariaefolia TaxID=1490495 RepID=A0A9W6XB84_9STRA|nr:unnamed protein product [Phytophthora fragariaefolia]